MYHPAVDSAQYQHDKHDLRSVFLSGEYFLKGLRIFRGHLMHSECSGFHVVDADFRNLQFLDLSFSACNWSDVQFFECELRDLRFRDCSFVRAHFASSSLGALHFENCYFEDCDIDIDCAGFVFENCVHAQKKLLSPAPTILAAEKQLPGKTPAPASGATGRFGSLDL